MVFRNRLPPMGFAFLQGLGRWARRRWVVAPLALGALSFLFAWAVSAQPAALPLPPDVAVEVALDLGAEPGKLQRLTVSGMERSLYPGMGIASPVVQRLKVRNASSGYGSAPVVFAGSTIAVGPQMVGPISPLTLAPGEEGELSWTVAVPPDAEVGPYETHITLTRDGEPFALLRLRDGAGEPIKLRSFSYVNASRNDVDAYLLFPGGTARLRFNLSNEGKAPLRVVGEVGAEAGLACTLEPPSANLAPGASQNFFLTCQGATGLTDANDRVTVRFRRSG